MGFAELVEDGINLAMVFHRLTDQEDVGELLNGADGAAVGDPAFGSDGALNGFFDAVDDVLRGFRGVGVGVGVVVEDAGAAATAGTAAGRSDRGKIEVGRDLVVGLDEQIGDVVGDDFGGRAGGEIVLGGDHDDAIFDGEIELCGAADGGEDLGQDAAEGNIAELDADGGVAVDAGIAEGFPVDQHVGAGVVAKEIENAFETELVGGDFLEVFIELLVGGAVGGGLPVRPANRDVCESDRPSSRDRRAGRRTESILPRSASGF